MDSVRWNGVGFGYLGKRDFDRRESFVSTLWFTFLWIPIYPVRSDRIRVLWSTGIEREYTVLEHLPLCMRQVILTYLVGLYYVLAIWWTQGSKDGDREFLLFFGRWLWSLLYSSGLFDCWRESP